MEKLFVLLYPNIRLYNYLERDLMIKGSQKILVIPPCIVLRNLDPKIFRTFFLLLQPFTCPPHGRLLDSSDIHTPTLCWPGILLSCLSMMPGQANDPSRALPFLKLQEIFPRSGSLSEGELDTCHHKPPSGAWVDPSQAQWGLLSSSTFEGESSSVISKFSGP